MNYEVAITIMRMLSGHYVLVLGLVQCFLLTVLSALV